MTVHTRTLDRCVFRASPVYRYRNGVLLDHTIRAGESQSKTIVLNTVTSDHERSGALPIRIRFGTRTLVVDLTRVPVRVLQF